MQSLFLVFLFFVLQTSGFGQQIQDQNDPKKHPLLVNKTTIQQLKGKPIDYYLNHKSIGETAKLFYKGQYAIYDDEGTFSIIDSVLTNNEETRPFYFFVFSEILKISDGSVSEYMSPFCTKYTRKYPCDFLRYANDMIIELDVNKWSMLVGYNLVGEKEYEEFVKPIDQKIKKECSAMASSWQQIKTDIKNHMNK